MLFFIAHKNSGVNGIQGTSDGLEALVAPHSIKTYKSQRPMRAKLFLANIIQQGFLSLAGAIIPL